eukprot:m.12847 g.12847  ORF g.12847 m.12847 type:complete len:383 (+) comp24330_c0_seq3:396-1544(+)
MLVASALFLFCLAGGDGAAEQDPNASQTSADKDTVECVPYPFQKDSQGPQMCHTEFRKGKSSQRLTFKWDTTTTSTSNLLCTIAGIRVRSPHTFGCRIEKNEDEDDLFLVVFQNTTCKVQCWKFETTRETKKETELTDCPMGSAFSDMIGENNQAIQKRYFKSTDSGKPTHWQTVCGLSRVTAELPFRDNVTTGSVCRISVDDYYWYLTAQSVPSWISGSTKCEARCFRRVQDIANKYSGTVISPTYCARDQKLTYHGRLCTLATFVATGSLDEYPSTETDDIDEWPGCEIEMTDDGERSLTFTKGLVNCAIACSCDNDENYMGQQCLGPPVPMIPVIPVIPDGPTDASNVQECFCKDHYWMYCLLATVTAVAAGYLMAKVC